MNRRCLNIDMNRVALLSLFIYLISAINVFAASTFQGGKIEEACIGYARSIITGESEVSCAKKIDDQYFDETGIKAKCTANSSNLRGLCYVSVEFYKDESLVKRLDVPMRVRIYREVPVLSRGLVKGSALDDSNIHLKKVEITPFKDGDLPSMDEIYGSRLNRSLTNGSALLRSYMEKQKAVKRGEKVTVIVQSGGVRIRTMGFALEDAAVGDKIKVRTDTAILQGEASGDGMVWIITN